MITVDQAVQKAKAYLRFYNSPPLLDQTIEVELVGHMYTMWIELEGGTSVPVYVDAETGGIINDIRF